MIKLGSDRFGSDGNNIVCPFCGSDYVHIQNHSWTDGYEDDGASAYRQGHLQIALYCEQHPIEHQWSYTFGEHKGEVYFEEAP